MIESIQSQVNIEKSNVFSINKTFLLIPRFPKIYFYLHLQDVGNRVTLKPYTSHFLCTAFFWGGDMGPCSIGNDLEPNKGPYW
jgi:hypothetical protein